MKKFTSFTLEMVPVDKLQSALSYQRLLLKSHSKRIKNEWDEMAAAVLTVGRRLDGSCWIVDGQHSHAVMQELGYSEAPCKVFNSNGQEHEAKIFRICNRDRKGITRVELHRALKIEGDETALAIDAIMREHGLEISCGSAWPNVKCVEALERCYKKGHLSEVVSILATAWHGLDDAFSAWTVRGLNYYFNRYGLPDDKEHRLIVKRIEKELPSRVVARGKSLAAEDRTGEAYGKVFENIIQKGRRTRISE